MRPDQARANERVPVAESGGALPEWALTSAILNSVDDLVALLDTDGSVVWFNAACERACGRHLGTVRGTHISELFDAPEEAARFAFIAEQWGRGHCLPDQEGSWLSPEGSRRVISWSGTAIPTVSGGSCIIVTGTDVTERRRLEQALLEVSAREQRRIGQDLHDGLGQHVTGTALLTKVLQQKVEEGDLSEADGLAPALERFAREVEDLFGVSCRLVCPRPVSPADVASAIHLFYIAQEAINNAVRHSQSHGIVISLSAIDGSGRLTVSDDGVGIGETTARPGGMGMHVMRVECLFPLRQSS